MTKSCLLVGRVYITKEVCTLGAIVEGFTFFWIETRTFQPSIVLFSYYSAVESNVSRFLTFQ